MGDGPHPQQGTSCPSGLPVFPHLWPWGGSGTRVPFRVRVPWHQPPRKPHTPSPCSWGGRLMG